MGAGCWLLVAGDQVLVQVLTASQKNLAVPLNR